MSGEGTDAWEMRGEMIKIASDLRVLQREFQKEAENRRRFEEIVLSKLSCPCICDYKGGNMKVPNNSEIHGDGNYDFVSLNTESKPIDKLVDEEKFNSSSGDVFVNFPTTVNKEFFYNNDIQEDATPKSKEKSPRGQKIYSESGQHTNSAQATCGLHSKTDAIKSTALETIVKSTDELNNVDDDDLSDTNTCVLKTAFVRNENNLDGSVTEKSSSSFMYSMDHDLRDNDLHVKTPAAKMFKPRIRSEGSAKGILHEGSNAPGVTEDYFIRRGLYIGKSQLCEVNSLSRQKSKSLTTKNELYVADPFTLSKALPHLDHVHLLDYIFDEALDLSEIIVETPLTQLCRHDLLSLKPDTWVQSEVINVVVELLTKKYREQGGGKSTTWFMPTRFTTESIGVGRDIVEFVVTHRYRDNYLGFLPDCRVIKFPIHHLDHWVLFVVKIDEMVVEIWDSLLLGDKSICYNLVDDVLQNLDKVFKHDIQMKKQPGWSFSKFKVNTLTFVPRQTNSHDCGVFLINFMDDKPLADFESHKFHSDDERARILLKLVRTPNNNMKTKLLSKVTVYASENLSEKDQLDEASDSIRNFSHARSSKKIRLS